MLITEPLLFISVCIAVPDSPRLGGVEAYLGVPYAGAPLGRLRFMPPSAPQSWPAATVRKAAEFGPVCPQIVPDLSREKEALRNVGRAVVFRGLAALQTGSERSFKPEDLNLAAKCPGNKGGKYIMDFGTL
jgi:hypothetical protein